MSADLPMPGRWLLSGGPDRAQSLGWEDRLVRSVSGCSINLALSCRGITGLSDVGVIPAAERPMVPMRGRAIYHENGAIKYQAFDRHRDGYGWT